MLTLADTSEAIVVIMGFALLVMLIVAVVLFQFIGNYVRARACGAPVTMSRLIGMRLRKVNARTIIFSHIMARSSGLLIPLDSMEAHFLAGGDVERVVLAMIAAKKAKLDLPWDTATAMDLAGQDPFAAVKDRLAPQAGNGINTDAMLGRKVFWKA